MTINLSDFEGLSRIAKDGVVCTLSTTHYILEAMIGSSETMVTTEVSFYTGAGLNLILRSALPPVGIR